MRTVLFTTILSFLLAFPALAQPTKGDYILGGSLGFNFKDAGTGSDKNQNFSFSIAPNFGKFISDKYLINGGLSYSYNKSYSKYGNNDFSEGTNQGIGISFGITRYYPLADKLFFTGSAYIGSGYGFGTSNSTFGTSSHSDNINGTIGVSPGLAYFINDRWMVYSSMGALSYNASYDYNVERTTHSVNLNLSANSFKIGVNYIFKGKDKSIRKDTLR